MSDYFLHDGYVFRSVITSIDSFQTIIDRINANVAEQQKRAEAQKGLFGFDDDKEEPPPDQGVEEDGEDKSGEESEQDRAERIWKAISEAGRSR